MSNNAPTTGAPSSSSSANKLKVLFVDNSRTTRAAMSMFLSNHGYEVDAVATGQDAIEKIKVEPFDVAVMDLYMPFMNGYEAAKIIRALPQPCKDIPLIALTASSDARDMDICKTAGMNEFVIKSKDNEALFTVLDAYAKKLGKVVGRPT